MGEFWTVVLAGIGIFVSIMLIAVIFHLVQLPLQELYNRIRKNVSPPNNDE